MFHRDLPTPAADALFTECRRELAAPGPTPAPELVAAMREQLLTAPAAPPRASRSGRPVVGGRLLRLATVKVVAIGSFAALGATSAMAATGGLPAPVQQVAVAAASHLGITLPGGPGRHPARHPTPAPQPRTSPSVVTPSDEPSATARPEPTERPEPTQSADPTERPEPTQSADPTERPEPTQSADRGRSTDGRSTDGRSTDGRSGHDQPSAGTGDQPGGGASGAEAGPHDGSPSPGDAGVGVSPEPSGSGSGDTGG